MGLGPLKEDRDTPKLGRDPHDVIGTPEGGQGDPKAGQGPLLYDWDPCRKAEGPHSGRGTPKRGRDPHNGIGDPHDAIGGPQ